MNKWLMRWLTVPATNETRAVETVQLWYVRWTSRHGRYHCDTQDEMEAFTSEAEANAFRDALHAAFRLTRNTSNETVVSVVKAGA